MTVEQHPPLVVYGVIFRPREPGGSWAVAEGEAGLPLVFSDKAMAHARAQAMQERYDKQLWHVIPMEATDG